jgi:hypothetical protein
MLPKSMLEILRLRAWSRRLLKRPVQKGADIAGKRDGVSATLFTENGEAGVSACGGKTGCCETGSALPDDGEFCGWQSFL